MKILYIQHVSVLGGSSRSLYELISNLPNSVEPTVLCPKGEFSDFLEAKGISTIYVRGVPQFDNTRIGFYRKFRWLILLREMYYLPFFIKVMNRCKKENFDIVHVNEITQIFSIIFGKKISLGVVSNVRSVQRKSDSWRNYIIEKIISRYVDMLIPIDETVKASLPSGVISTVVHNGITLDNIKLNKQSKKFTVGIVSNFQRYKGILEFIDAANICINENKLDINFVVYGASYNKIKHGIKDKLLQILGFRENLDEMIENKIKKYNLGSNFELKGYVANHNNIYNFIDILVFPSHLNAVGRPVFEAAFYKVPSIVAIKNPLKDTMIDNVTGLVIKEKDKYDLADKILYFYSNPSKLKMMGLNAFKNANKNFNSQINSLKVFDIYQNIIKKS